MKKLLHVILFTLFLINCLNAQQASFDVRVNLPAGDLATHSIFPQNGGVVLLGGYFAPPSSFGLRIVRNDSEGDVVWVRTYSNPRYSFLYISSVVKSIQGGFWVAINGTSASSQKSEALIVKFDSAGYVVREKYINAPDAPYYQVGAQVHIAESADSSLYLTFNENSDTSSVIEYYTVLSHLSPSGNVIWTQVLADFNALPIKIDATNANRIHILGSFGTDHVVTFNSSGQIISSAGYQPASQTSVGPAAWHIDSAGYIRALLFNTAAGDAVLLKFDTAGNVVSSLQTPGISGRLIVPVQNDYISSGINNSTSERNFCYWQQSSSATPALNYLMPTNNYYVQNITRLANGALLIVAGDYSFQSSTPNSILRTDPAYNGTLPVSGCNMLADTIVISPIQINEASQAHVLTSKQNTSYITSSILDSEPVIVEVDCKHVGITETIQENNLLLFPNPASGWLIVGGGFENNTQLNIYNSAAKLVYTATSQRRSNELSLDVSNLPEGIYLIQAVSENGQTTTARLLVKH